MKRKAMAVILGALLALSTAGSALADGNNPSNPDGATTGYEGQPGNQSSGGGDGNNPSNPGGATTGYEGQPGNQSNGG
jgi:hypothetical protein